MSALCICGDKDCDIPYGTCHCGCGTKTTIWQGNDKYSGGIKGKPKKRVRGHTYKKRIILEDAVPFKIDGEYCRLISLTRGLYAIVWGADYKYLMQWKWFAYWNDHTKTYYAARNSKSVKDEVTKKWTRYSIAMHRQLFGLEKGDERTVDHAEPSNTLDNRRSNLRIANCAEQSRNRRISKVNTSGEKGVYLMPWGKWRAMIRVDKKLIHLGLFDTKEEAYAAYCKAALEYHKEFARLR